MTCKRRHGRRPLLPFAIVLALAGCGNPSGEPDLAALDAGLTQANVAGTRGEATYVGLRAGGGTSVDPAANAGT